MLAEVTQAVRKYAAEKQRVPTSVQEVVAAGYLRAPAVPPGKKLVINNRLEVELQ